MNTVGTALIILSILLGAILCCWRRARYFGLAIGLCGVGFFVFFYWQSARWEDAFKRLAIGASEQEIVVAMGLAPRITDCTEQIIPGYKKSKSQLIPGCVKEYWYRAFLWPEQLSYSFNAQGKLIDKYIYFSY
jgi:predicted membrane metal-binding protein